MVSSEYTDFIKVTSFNALGTYLETLVVQVRHPKIKSHAAYRGEGREIRSGIPLSSPHIFP